MTIFIPTPLRQFTGGKDIVETSTATVSEALDALTAAHPELRKHLFTPEGKIRAFVNLYLNDEDIRYLPEKEATAIKPTDTLSIIPSIAGGGCHSMQTSFPGIGSPSSLFWVRHMLRRMRHMQYLPTCVRRHLDTSH
jgi:molybdopterin converting factor small subunit